jgi:hypothetical protein
MAEATNALHCHEIARTERRVTQRVVRRYTRTKKRGRVDGFQRVRKRDHRVSIRKHHFRVSAIHANSGYGEIAAIDKVSSAAKLTGSVVTTEKADADSLSDTPLRDTRANCFDASCRFVPRHPWKSETWKLTLDR